MIARYFALAAETAASMDAVGQLLTARHMIDLVALVLRTGPDNARLATQGYSEARLQLIQAHVLDRLDDNSLTIASVARRFGLSAKLVQRLFERADMTFTGFVSSSASSWRAGCSRASRAARTRSARLPMRSGSVTCHTSIGPTGGVSA